MTSPEEEIIHLIEDPYAFFDLQLDAIKAVVAQAYEAGRKKGPNGLFVDFEEWWGGGELSG